MSLLVPFEYEFFRNGFIAAVVIGALCGFIGVYVVLRRMSYIGHGLSHAIFGGAVLSYVLNINFFIGGGLWALLAGVLIHWISHRRWVGADAAIGVVTTSSFALASRSFPRTGPSRATSRPRSSATSSASPGPTTGSSSSSP